jgi:hypothetical protein
MLPRSSLLGRANPFKLAMCSVGVLDFGTQSHLVDSSAPHVLEILLLVVPDNIQKNSNTVQRCRDGCGRVGLAGSSTEVELLARTERSSRRREKHITVA